jgi:glycosyltransferase involved in cell wall biosynthesis
MSGHGAAMRAGVFIEALAELYDISLVVLNLWDRTPCLESPIIQRCSTFHHFSITELEVLRRKRRRVPLFDFPVQHVHVNRLSMVRFISSCWDCPSHERPSCTLDLDDYESKLFLRMARQYANLGDSGRARVLLRRASLFEAMESKYLHVFDQVYVSNPRDLEEISEAYSCKNVHLVPNVVRLPIQKVLTSSGVLKLLFVGTLDYFPNEDALGWFCSDILPIIRQKATVRCKVSIVGSRPSDAVLKLGELLDVSISPDVISVEPFYDDSTIAIVPLRAAGGTRIKILEAFSHSCPVVATSVGAEGLEVKAGEQLLIGDSPSAFAEHCLRLMGNASLRKEIGAEGFRWVSGSHLVDHVTELLRRLFHDNSRSGSMIVKALEV